MAANNHTTNKHSTKLQQQIIAEINYQQIRESIKKLAITLAGDRIKGDQGLHMRRITVI